MEIVTREITLWYNIMETDNRGGTVYDNRTCVTV